MDLHRFATEWNAAFIGIGDFERQDAVDLILTIFTHHQHFPLVLQKLLDRSVFLLSVFVVLPYRVT